MGRAASWILLAFSLAGFALSAPGVGVAFAKTDKPAEEKKGKGAKKPKTKACPSDMVSVWGGFCIDRYEAYVIEMLKGGKVRKHSPYMPPAKDKKYRAANQSGRMPQAHISREQAALACKNAGKRLCTDEEWITACKGKKPTTWPYGDEQKVGRCNDNGISSFQALFGPDGGGPPPQSAYTWENLNDPRLNQAKNTCAPSGRHKKCKNSFKVYDMVGNLHEWTADPGGTFRGG